MNTPEPKYRFPTADAIKKLATRFRLPSGPDMQDWEWEVADCSRIDEFLSVYESEPLSDDERFTLMEIIIQSFEDLASGCNLVSEPRWKRTMGILETNIALHAYSVWYWSCQQAEDEDEAFHVSPFMKEIIALKRDHFASAA